MKTLTIVSVIASVLFFSCSSQQDDNGDMVEDSTHIIVTDDSAFFYLPDSVKLVGTHLYKWQVNFDAKTVKSNPILNNTPANVDSIIQGLRLLHPDVILIKKLMSGDTLYTEIPNSEYLSERMGDSGPANYFANAVINLTAVPGIRFIKIDFKDGTHATHGVWTRDDYKDFKGVQ